MGVTPPTNPRDRAALILAGELVAAITHDLRQPLTAMEMNVEAAVRLLEAHLQRTGGAGDASSSIPEAIAALRDAIAEHHRLREALQIMLDLSMRREPALHPLDLSVVTRRAADVVRAEMAGMHPVIDVTADPAAPRILGDEVLVRQAMLNVLIDAVERSRPDNASEAVVAVRVYDDGDGVVASVRYPGDAAVDADRSALALARTVAQIHGATFTSRDDGAGWRLVTSRWPVASSTSSPRNPTPA